MTYIHETNFRKLDFHLLELFSELMRLRSVTQAALILDVPQPTASRNLNRLREVIGDELFVRTTHGMQPTAKAFEIAGTIEEILSLGNSLETIHRTFDPLHATRTFVISGSDVGLHLILPPLYRAVAGFPGISFKVAGVPGNDLGQALEDGEIDLAFGPYPSLMGGIKQQKLYDEYYGCYCRPDHPLVREPTMQTFLTCNHLLAVGRAFAHAHREAESRLRELLPANSIRVVTENYLVALFALVETDLVLTAPTRVVEPAVRRLNLVRVEPPVELQGFEVKQYWHVRSHEDNGHRWLRSTLREALIRENVAGLGNHAPPDAD